MMAGLLQVEYTCHACGVGSTGGRVKVTVRHRAEGQNIVDWVNDCARLVSMDHGRRSPHCPSKICDLLIPMNDSERIGYVPAAGK